jgi:KaiC/GvpD/RAD55 family RecA-like ATPase
MEFGQEFERIFFKLSLHQPKYLKSIKTGFYDTEELDLLHYLALKFYDKFNETPSKEQMKLLIKNSKKTKDKLSDEIVDKVYDVNIDEYDDEWLTNSAESWIKYKSLDTSLQDIIEYVKTTTVTPDNCDHVVNKVKDMINERNNLNFNSDLGLDFFNPEDHYQAENEKISTGYNFLDRILNGGYDKGGNLVVYAGEQSIGKSIYLANDAANFMKKGFNTAVITAEMEPHKFVKRIGSNLLNINIDEYGEVAQNKEYIKKRLETVGDGITPPGQLQIKRFPTSQATVIDIESYLQQLEEEKQIKLGAVVIDYINILSNYRNPNTENTYIKIKDIAEDLRAMGQRNDWLIITATQITRSGYNSTDITFSDIAESAGLSHTADVMLGIIQDEIMYTANEYQLKVLKIRDGEGKGTKCKINIDRKYMRLIETEEINTSSIHSA